MENVTHGLVNDTASCKKFYQTNFGIKAAVVFALCMNESDPNNYLNITTFNFYSDPKKTSQAWVDIFLNNVTRKPEYYVDLIYSLNMTSTDLNALIWGKTSKVKTYMNTKVLKPIFDFYYNATCTEPECIRWCS